MFTLADWIIFTVLFICAVCAFVYVQATQGSDPKTKVIVLFEQDILMDMAICDIEGWDKMEFINQLRELVNGFNV